MKAKFILLFSLAFLFSNGVQSQIYVKHDAIGSNDGTSWENAFTDLDEALSTSAEGDQIWVAAGAYKPGGTSPSVDAFFSFPHDLELFDGFVGIETMLSERD